MNPPTLSYQAKRIDDRRNKRYARQVVIDIYSDGHQSLAGVTERQIITDVRAARVAAGLDVPALHSDSGFCGAFDVDHRGLVVTYDASKPSEILHSDEACVFAAALASDILASIERQRRIYLDEQSAENDASVATHVATFIGSTVRDKAKTIVRFEQRLAALKAELAAECEVQLPVVLSDEAFAQQLAEAAEAHGWSDRAIATARAHASGFTRDRDDHFPPVMGRTINSTQLVR